MSTSWEDRTLTEDLLARAVDDWVSAAEVIGLVRRSGVDDPVTLLDLAIGLITRLLAQEAIVAGDTADGGFRAWDCSPGEAASRVALLWSNRKDPFVGIGEIAWFDTTPRGQELGESVLAREAGSEVDDVGGAP